MKSAAWLRHPRIVIACTALAVSFGVWCMSRLTVEEFPSCAPPILRISADAHGLDAASLADVVARPVDGVVETLPDVIYRHSVCDADGKFRMDVAFRTGTNCDSALAALRESVRRASPLLPAEVAGRLTVDVRPSEPAISYAFRAETPEAHRALGDFVMQRIRPAALRAEGVASVEIAGIGRTCVSIIPDAVRLSGLGLDGEAIIRAVRSADLRQSATALPGGAVRMSSFVRSPEDLENLVLREDATTGGRIRIKDVARVEVSREGEHVVFDGGEAVIISVFPKDVASAAKVAHRVTALLKDELGDLPQRTTCGTVRDADVTCQAFLRETSFVLLLSFLFVIVATFAFFRDWRTTLVVALAVPVSILVSFVLQSAAGVGLNALSLFGLAVVIGSLVDDSLVVIERMRVGMASGLRAREAAALAVRHSFAPVIAMTVVTVACYLPLTFVRGFASALYLQFAFTVSSAILTSAVVSLVLIPVLAVACGVPAARLKADSAVRGTPSVGWWRPVLAWLVVAVALAGVAPFAGDTPKTLFAESVGGFVLDVALPQDAKARETSSVCGKLERLLTERIPEQGLHVLTCTGSAPFSGNGENRARVEIVFDGNYLPNSRRETCLSAVIGCAAEIEALVPGAQVTVLENSAAKGVGRFNGLEFHLVGKGAVDCSERFRSEIRKIPGVAYAACSRPETRERTRLTVDVGRAEGFGITLDAVSSALFGMCGERRVAGFPFEDVSADVVLRQGRGAGDVSEVMLESATGASVRLSSVCRRTSEVTLTSVASFNGKDCVDFIVRPDRGESPERLVARISELADRSGLEVAWSGAALQEIVNHGGTRILLGMSLLLVYLLLTVWLDSWSRPVAIVAATLVSVCGAFAGLVFTGGTMNVYSQMALVTVVAFAVKSVSLLVGSRWMAANGVSKRQARMVVWTSLAGALPLLFSAGSGCVAQRAIGVVAVGGLVSLVALVLPMVPGLLGSMDRTHALLGSPVARMFRFRQGGKTGR